MPPSSPQPPRTILHVDMDAFFASIEVLDQPDLADKPLLVGYDGPRGVVCTASYAARKFGCHSGQAMTLAKQRCPQAIIKPVRSKRYQQFSHKLFAILNNYSPLVEPLSVDEAFVDLTGTQRALGPPAQVGHDIKNRIQQELALTASVGIAPNKFLAKIASDHQKPNGHTLVTPSQIQNFLDPLSIRKVWGIGPVTGKKMQRLGITTVADLRSKSQAWLNQTLGSDAQRYYNLSRGIDDRPVIADHEAKSIGHEQTFATNIDNPQTLHGILLGQVEEVTRRLRNQNKKARTTQIKIRYGNFETITRSAALENPTDSTDQIWLAAKALFDKWARGDFQSVRLIGVAVTGFGEQAQMGLFTEAVDEKRRSIDGATDAIVARFGKGAIRRGKTL